MPANSGCPCVTTIRSGNYTIGGSSNPLTAGAEYSIYAQTKTAAGLLSEVFTITQSTYVASMTSPVVDANSTSITLSVTFESGVGSSVDCVLKDLQGNQVQAQTALDFKSVHQFGLTLPPIVFFLCFGDHGSFPFMPQLSGCISFAPNSHIFT